MEKSRDFYLAVNKEGQLIGKSHLSDKKAKRNKAKKLRKAKKNNSNTN